MHDYSINNNERVIIYFFCALISVCIMYLISNLVENIPWYLESPSPFFIYGIIVYFFDKYLWNKNFFKILIKTPDMNGEYAGMLKSSYDDFNKEYPVNIVVKQTWTKIIISLKTDTSESNSKGASIVFENEKIYLFYYYLNKPNFDSVDSMQIHFGTCTHVFDDKTNCFNAEYYSSRGRKNHGTITLTKISKN